MLDRLTPDVFSRTFRDLIYWLGYAGPTYALTCSQQSRFKTTNGWTCNARGRAFQGSMSGELPCLQVWSKVTFPADFNPHFFI